MLKVLDNLIYICYVASYVKKAEHTRTSTRENDVSIAFAVLISILAGMAFTIVVAGMPIIKKINNGEEFYTTFFILIVPAFLFGLFTFKLLRKRYTDNKTHEINTSKQNKLSLFKARVLFIFTMILFWMILMILALIYIATA